MNRHDVKKMKTTKTATRARTHPSVPTSSGRDLVPPLAGRTLSPSLLTKGGGMGGGSLDIACYPHPAANAARMKRNASCYILHVSPSMLHPSCFIPILHPSSS